MRPSVRHLLLGGLFGAGRPAGNLLGGEMAGFAADFVNRDLLIRGKGDYSGDPNNKLTYTAPSTKYVRNASGVYTAGTTLRCDHLANGTALGLLVEGQRTNVLLQSQVFNTTWGKTDITVTSNATTAPDGTMTADLLTEGTAGTAAISQVGTIVSASAQVSGSIFAKASANNNWIEVILADNATVQGVNVWVNLSTGAIGTVTPRTGSVTVYGATIEAAANGFYRVLIYATFPAGTTDAILYLRSASADNSTTRVNNAAYYVWQAQLELGARPSSPIVTTSAAVTRAADDIYVSLSALPFDATKGTLLAKMVPGSIASGTKALVTLLQDNNNYLRINLSTASRRGQNVVAASAVADIGTGSGVVGTAFKAAFSWKANDFAFAADGTLGTPDTSGALPTPTRLQVGSFSAGSGHIEGWLQYLIQLPRKQSDAELVAWSTL